MSDTHLSDISFTNLHLPESLARGIAARRTTGGTGQQAMDREYLRLRQVETRHRLLFQVTSEAVLIVDASNQRVVEANPAGDRRGGGLDSRRLGAAVPPSRPPLSEAHAIGRHP